MMEHEEDKYDPDTSLLCKYVDIFLRNQSLVKKQEDKRVLLYRGQSNKDYSLMPSVFREQLLIKEYTMIQEMLLREPEAFTNIRNPFEQLTKMQHYGLPTRLLDFTTNPLVAMYFACTDNNNNNNNKEGEVLVFYDYLYHSYNSNVLSLAALTKYTGSSERQILGLLTENNITNVSAETFIKMNYIAVEAPHNNECIKRQNGAFIMAGLNGGKNDNPYQKEAFDLKSILIKNFDDGIERSIIIPKEEKKELVNELDALGINGAFLFPELEHQAIYIRQKHKEV
jgi:hypothetical protein